MPFAIGAWLVRAILALALGFGLYWGLEQLSLATDFMPLVQVAVWLSPLSIFGWAAMAGMVVLAALLVHRVWPLKRFDTTL
jgi:hypothetical protein